MSGQSDVATFSNESMDKLLQPSNEEVVTQLLEPESAGTARPDLHQLARRDPLGKHPSRSSQYSRERRSA